MTTGAWIAIAAVAIAVAFGLYRAATDGRFTGTKAMKQAKGAEPGHEDAGSETPVINLLAGTPWADELGERATLLQFSSAFCAPCRATRRILTDVAAARPDVAHIEVDAEQHLDVVRRLDILRTPTTIVLDPQGRELVRASGAPTAAQ
ncbi:MAG: thioredoxin family protein, partial [Alphaproteobacteria bacterium]|nr:thioredoxin family protein [Alphaproteobacteria bacterium]